MAADSSPLLPARAPQPLAPERLYRRCDPSSLAFSSTEELEPLAEFIGQQRATEALEFGLDIGHAGFNIFLLGSTGAGKRELLDVVLERHLQLKAGETYDWCYVNNFDFPDKPIALRLPCGIGCQLRNDMAGAVEELLAILPATFQSEEYHSRVQEIGEHFQEREKTAFQDLVERAAAKNIAMIETPSGYTLAPMQDGEIITPKDFEALADSEKQATLDEIELLKEELKGIMRLLPGWKKESREAFKKMNRETGQLAIDPVFRQLKERYRDLDSVLAYLDAVHVNVIDEAEAFVQQREDSVVPDNPKDRVREFPQYSVNVLVDNSKTRQVPVVFEDNPSFANLIGRSEHVAQMGTLVTDFTLIKAGALHRANGGFLILEADKVLTNPYAWTGLKRALKAGHIRIQSLDQFFSFASTVQLEPETIELNVKLVLTGDRYLYHLLREFDAEFSTLFKVAADMSEDVPRDEDSNSLYARMLKALQQQAGLLPLSQSGVARLIEHAARQVEDSERLSVHRGRLGNLLAESDYLARKGGATVIDAEHVAAALAAANYRLDQFRERSRESILRDIMLIQTEGEVVGQVNGLAVYMLGDYSFGRPTRITATARLGTGRVLDIEREVELGGKIHSKAVLIIGALLAQRYARDRPLPLAATLVFEQSYSGVEGDSASIAELVALISAVTDIPVRQHLAVTGSLNQHGQVQPVGGVNDKIEGFFEVCRDRGLSGEQGVIIPQANEVNLMLREDVREAAAAGLFHVISVADVDQALELLTGVRIESIDSAVNARIDALLELAGQYAVGKDEHPSR